MTHCIGFLLLYCPDVDKEIQPLHNHPSAKVIKEIQLMYFTGLE